MFARFPVAAALVAAAVLVLPTGCRKTGGDATTSNPAAQEPAGPDPVAGPATASGSGAAPGIEPAATPADVTGAYLFCAQTDEAAADAPSQDGLASGERELMLGCAVAGADGIKRPGAAESLVVTLALADESPLLLRTILAKPASSWHVLFRLPLHLAVAARGFSGAMARDGTSVTLAPPPAAGGVDGAAPPGLVLVTDVVRAEGRVEGGQLLLLKGLGLRGVKSVALGGTACAGAVAHGDRLVTCVTTEAPGPAADLTVAVETGAGEARLARGFSFVTGGASPCDLATTRQNPLAADGAGGALEVCTRKQLEDALGRGAGKSIILRDNVDLDAGVPFTVLPPGAPLAFDGGGFVLRGLVIDNGAGGASASLFGAATGMTIRNLGVVGFRVVGGVGVGVLIGSGGVGATVEHVVIADGSVEGTTQVGGLAGLLGNTEPASLTDVSVNDVTITASAGNAGGVAGLYFGKPRLPLAQLEASVTIARCPGSCGGLFGDLQIAGEPSLPMRGLRAKVTLPDQPKNAGGLAGIGSLDGVWLADLDVEVAVAGSIAQYAGGLFGYMSTRASRIDDVRVRGELVISGRDLTVGGGLFGTLTGSDLTASRVDVSVSLRAVGTAGGLVGDVKPNFTLEMSDVRQSGAVTASRFASGVIGTAASVVDLSRVLVLGAVTAAVGTIATLDPLVASGLKVTAQQVFWDQDRVGLATTLGADSGALPGTRETLQSPGTFGDGGWADAWRGVPNDYPRLLGP